MKFGIHNTSWLYSPDPGEPYQWVTVSVTYDRNSGGAPGNEPHKSPPVR
jgi:hypothetical protein